MDRFVEFTWKGERNRPLDVYRPCSCGTCSATQNGIGYLSFSDGDGWGFTVWLEDEEVFLMLKAALENLKQAR